MSLIGQIWLKLFVVIVLAFVGGVAVHTDSMRDTLQSQLRMKNADNASAMALVLSQQKGDQALMDLALSAQFDTGYYRRIRLVGSDGAVLFAREAQPRPQDAPRWFERLLPIESPAGDSIGSSRSNQRGASCGRGCASRANSTAPSLPTRRMRR